MSLVFGQIPCVMPEWLYDSVQRGSCLAMEEYKTADKTKRSSTPTKNHTLAGGTFSRPHSPSVL